MKPRAAIYARRSTDEHQVESLDTQLDNGRRFGLARAYELDPVLEFTDTASRAEFAPRRRPGLAALREAALAGEFDAVIVRDDSRLGGDMLRVATFAQELTDAGVKIVFYATGEEMVLESETSRLLAVMRGFASETERRRISSRTRENLERKARRGLVAGGVVYGYRNVPAPDGSGKVREIDEAQAAIVREIFERYAEGEGLRTIVKTLTERGVASPRAGKRGIGTWVPSVIHSMLRRPLYAGRVEWGHIHKMYKSGTKTRTTKHAHEVVVVDAPHLRIVPEHLWAAVQARVSVPQSEEKPGGRPPAYLLSGILRCGECGGPLTVINGKSSQTPIKVYTCCRRRDRGGVACPSTLRRDVAAVDGAIVEWIRREVLTEDFVTAAMNEIRRRVAERAEASQEEITRLEVQAEKLRADIDKFSEIAIEAPKDVRPVFLAKMNERQVELTALDTRLRAMKTMPRAMDLEFRRLEQEARRRIVELAEMMDRRPSEARAFARALFPEGLTTSPLTPPEGGRRMRVEGLAAPGRALGIEVGKSASPAGPGRYSTEIRAGRWRDSLADRASHPWRVTRLGRGRVRGGHATARPFGPVGGRPAWALRRPGPGGWLLTSAGGCA